MRRSYVSLTTLAAMLASSLITVGWMYGGSAWAQQSGRAGVFGGLSAGQVVSVQDKQGYIEIDVISPNPQNVGSHRVVQISSDYIVIEDVVHVTRSWIPVTAVRRINFTNLDAGLAKPQQ
jgi:hypothetical protein